MHIMLHCTILDVQCGAVCGNVGQCGLRVRAYKKFFPSSMGTK